MAELAFSGNKLAPIFQSAAAGKITFFRNPLTSRMEKDADAAVAQLSVSLVGPASREFYNESFSNFMKVREKTIEKTERFEKLVEHIGIPYVCFQAAKGAFIIGTMILHEVGKIPDKLYLNLMVGAVGLALTGLAAFVSYCMASDIAKMGKQIHWKMLVAFDKTMESFHIRAKNNRPSTGQNLN